VSFILGQLLGQLAVRKYPSARPRGTARQGTSESNAAASHTARRQPLKGCVVIRRGIIIFEASLSNPAFGARLKKRPSQLVILFDEAVEIVE
jgi:hypothetical protein